MARPLSDTLREWWDADASTYGQSAGHHPSDPAERAAWAMALDLFLPAGGRVLDVGAGTGFLSLLAAALGREVTAIDFSQQMLDRIAAEADRLGLPVRTVRTDAASPPPGPFDAVMQRHVLWTLPDPRAALVSWRRVAPTGRLLLFEGLWGRSGRGVEAWQGRARAAWHRLARRDDHHAPYPQRASQELPLLGGADERGWCELVEATGWGPARLVRLRDIEWTRLRSLSPGLRALGTVPQFCVIGGSSQTRQLGAIS